MCAPRDDPVPEDTESGSGVKDTDFTKALSVFLAVPGGCPADGSKYAGDADGVIPTKTSPEA
jgi:hypothetical protein